MHENVPFKTSRKYSAGMIALRPDRDGVIAHYEGFDQIQKRFGEWLENNVDWNISRAADSLGLERTHLHKKMRALGIRRERGLQRVRIKRGLRHDAQHRHR